MYQLHSRCLIKFFIRHRKAGVCRNPENHIDSTVRRVDKQTSARSSVTGTRQKMEYRIYHFPPCSRLLWFLSSLSVLNLSLHMSHLNFFLLKSNFIMPV